MAIDTQGRTCHAGVPLATRPSSAIEIMKTASPDPIINEYQEMAGRSKMKDVFIPAFGIVVMTT
jgi:hypothetical protein